MKSKFTICIPTYNRGKRALKLVENLLLNLKEDQSVLVLNNASTVETEAYLKIKNISEQNTQLSYFEQKNNMQFYGNFKSCLMEANSKYILIISDEDFVNFEELESIIEDLDKIENLGACRTSIKPHHELLNPVNSHIFELKYCKAGEEALKGFCFSNNYISGIIYNLENIKKTNLIESLECGINSHKAYPHLYFDLLVSAEFDVLISPKVSILEGKPEADTLDDDGKKATIFNHIGLYGYGERVNQFFALRDAILESVNRIKGLNDNDRFIIFLSIYLLLVQKYFYLISNCNMPHYIKNFLNESLLNESFYYLVISAIVNYPQIEPYKELMLNAITDIYANYK